MTGSLDRPVRHRGVLKYGPNTRRSRALKTKLTVYSLILLPTLYIVVLQIIPLVREIQLSFTDTTLTAPNDGSWVGLENYRNILTDPDFHHTALVTSVYVVVCIIFPVGVGLCAALLLNGRFPARRIFRSLVVVPYAAPGVAIALILVWMLNPQYGILTRLASVIGLNVPAGMMQDTRTALPAILVITIWQLFPFNAIVLLSALQSVPKELVEATMLDGGGSRWIFTDVIWPTIRPIVWLLLTLNAIWSIRRFELIWVMTKGGPDGATKTLVIDLYSEAFELYHLGRAAAIGMVGVVVSLLFVLASLWVQRGKAQ